MSVLCLGRGGVRLRCCADFLDGFTVLLLRVCD